MVIYCLRIGKQIQPGATLCWIAVSADAVGSSDSAVHTDVDRGKWNGGNGRSEFGPMIAGSVSPLEPAFQVGFAVAHHAAGGQVLVPDGLPKLHVSVKVFLEGFDPYMGGDGLESGGVQLL